MPRSPPRWLIWLGGVLGVLATSSAFPQQGAPPLPEVTVQAQRQALEPRVRAFVDRSVYLENDEGAPRWEKRVCPTVMGLSKDEGEFILSRLSQIGRKVGVPLDGEECAKPNLYVLVTAKPEEFMTKWAKARHWRMFGVEAMPSAIKTFIETPQPVRVWYNSARVGSGTPSMVDAHLGVSLPNSTAESYKPTDPEAGGPFVRDVKWDLKSAIVVVDKSKMDGVSRGQLADYIAMCAFSHVKVNAVGGDAPTILKLFKSSAAQRPQGLTTWDEAFLESLYHVNSALVMQNMMIVQRMVKDIIPASSDASQPAPTVQ